MLPRGSLTAQGAGLLASALARAGVEGPAGMWAGLSAAARGVDAERLDWLSAANLVDAFRPRRPPAAAAGEAEDSVSSPLLADDSEEAPAEAAPPAHGGEAGGGDGWREGGPEALEWIGQAIVRAGRAGLTRGEDWAGAQGGVGGAVARVVCGMAAAGRLADDALYAALRREVRQ